MTRAYEIARLRYRDPDKVLRETQTFLDMKAMQEKANNESNEEAKALYSRIDVALFHKIYRESIDSTRTEYQWNIHSFGTEVEDSLLSTVVFDCKRKELYDYTKYVPIYDKELKKYYIEVE